MNLIVQGILGKHDPKFYETKVTPRTRSFTDDLKGHWAEKDRVYKGHVRE